MDFFLGLGYFGLFLGSLLAGSIIPFSSEILLTGMIAGDFNPYICLICVTLGNTAGGMTCYFIGKAGKTEWITKYLKIKPETLQKSQNFVQKRGAIMALLSWVPYMGEAISVTLGLMRTKTLPVLIFMTIGKLARYVVMLLIIMGVITFL